MVFETSFFSEDIQSSYKNEDPQVVVHTYQNIW